mmetsp:Transcript_4813/g.10187  ORF Transcript_4813/g.10187 Transcript_4813/m.10187 type:complete len:195 (+) Transcript_4813:502-1086(+)
MVTEKISKPAAASQPGEGRRKKTSVLIDFMTKGGATHPVWYDEVVKWNVFLGGNIEGEIRVKILGTKVQREATKKATNGTARDTDAIVHTVEEGSDPGSGSSKLARLMAYADSYDRRMNLYSNNCRIFAARMEREAERINLECMDITSASQGDWSHDMAVANLRCSLRILWAAFLPSLYPLGVILLLCEGFLIR